MTKFLSRKHSIEALQNDGSPERIAEIRKWVEDGGGEVWINPDPQYSQNVVVHRPDAMLYLVRVHDWLCKADEGKFFPMRNDDFNSLYKGAA